MIVPDFTSRLRDRMSLQCKSRIRELDRKKIKFEGKQAI